jgi:hypothetical protein
MLVVLVAAGGLPGPGCGPSARQWGGGQYAVAEPGGGEHRCVIQYLTCEGRPFFVVWADGCDLPPGRDLRASSLVWGEITAAGGRRVVWCCETDGQRAGRDGLFSIAEPVRGQFRLSAGGLFLVYGRETPVRIEQVAADLSSVGPEPTPDELLRAGAGDQRVATFHAACSGRR